MQNRAYELPNAAGECKKFSFFASVSSLIFRAASSSQTK